MRPSISSRYFSRPSQLFRPRVLSPPLTPNRRFHLGRLHPLSPSPAFPRYLAQQQRRWTSPPFIRQNTSLATPSSPQATNHNPKSSSPTTNQPAYELYFTCKPCSHRSGPHRITKQGFHKGTTMITCPSCKNRHVISDHLRIFTDEGGDLVDIMKRHGGKLKKGRLGIRNGELIGNEGEEEIEFWEDGTETPHITQEAGDTH